MRIAIITGASAGLGEAFARRVRQYFPDVEQLWLVSRRREPLEIIAGRLGNAVTVPLDLTDRTSFRALEAKLAAERPVVSILINNAGCGYLGEVGRGKLEDQLRMTDLNVTALTAAVHLTLPYMTSGSRILNVSSIASFCPNPRMAVYSSTKAYVSSFTRALACEVRSQGIRATAVCPGPMATNFLVTGRIAGRSRTFEVLPYCDPERVAEGALAAAKAGRAFYTPRMFYKVYRVLAKAAPHALLAPLVKC